MDHQAGQAVKGVLLRSTPSSQHPTSTEVVPFDYGPWSLSGHVDADNIPWVGGVEAATILGYANPQQALRRLDNDEKGIRSVSTLGGQQEVVFINESGLYSLILRSRKPEAKAFKRWVTHDLLPTLRRTGRYDLGTLEAQQRRLQFEVRTLERQREALAPITDGPRGLVVRHVCAWLDDLPEPQRGVLHLMAQQATVQDYAGPKLALVAGVLWRLREHLADGETRGAVLRHGRGMLHGEYLLLQEWPRYAASLCDRASGLVALFHDWGYELHVWPGKMHCARLRRTIHMGKPAAVA